MNPISVILLVLLIDITNGYLINHSKFSVIRLNKAIKFPKQTQTFTKTNYADVSEVQISLKEYLSPPFIDIQAIGYILAGQGLILNLGFLYGFFGGFDKNAIFLFSFDKESMTLALQYSIALIVIGQIIDRLPIKFFQNLALDTRVFVLRIIGRQTPFVTAVLTAFLLSAGAGLSEELVFRGCLFVYLQNSVGNLSAYVISSLIFGLAHSPIFGASTAVEIIIGIIFAYIFEISGKNLAVPIAVHTIYDFTTILITWWYAKEQLRKQILEVEKGKLIKLSTSDSEEYKSLACAVFNSIDINGDGYIDQVELDRGMRLFGFGSHPFGKQLEGSKELFRELDKNNDGRISIEEFIVFMNEGLYQWPYKPYRRPF